MSRRDDRRDERRDERPAVAEPIKAATPTRETQIREAEREVGVRSPAPISTGDRFAGHNQTSDGTPTSLSSSSDHKSGGPNHVVVETKKPDEVKKEPEPVKKPDPEPVKPEKRSGRSHLRGSTIGLKKERNPEGRTQDAVSKKAEAKEVTRKRDDPQEHRKNRNPEGRTQDAVRKKPEVVCKAPPRGEETKPKGGGGSGKRFVPYIGSKACK